MLQHYKIVITGKLLEGCDAATVSANLVRNFKITEKQADRFLSGKPFIVKDNLEYQAAEKYRDAFEKAGLASSIEKTAAQSDAARAAGSAEHTAPQQQEAMYKVVFTGTIAPGNSVQDVKHALAQLYKTDIQKIERLFAGKPVVIKDRIDGQSALRLQAMLKKTGAVCSIQPPITVGGTESVQPRSAEPSGSEFSRSLALSSQEMPQHGAAALPKCPKCGYQANSPEDLLLTGQGGLGECPACGIIVAKYIKQASRPAASEPIPPAKSTAPAASPASASGAASAKKVVPEGTTTGIEVRARFFPLAIMMYFCYAHVDVDGEVHKIDWWKTSFYPLLPGAYTIRIYVSYPSKPQLGLIAKEITVGEKIPCKLDFYLFPWSSGPGSLTVNGRKSGAAPKMAQSADPEAIHADSKTTARFKEIFAKIFFWKKQAP